MAPLSLFGRFRARPRRATPAPAGAARAPRLRQRSRAAVLFAPFAFLAILAGGWSAAETHSPEITDTEYHQRLRIARARAAEHPDNPLGVVVGSSRVVWAFRPEVLPDAPPAGDVYWVNAAHTGAGPILNRLLLHRLLRDGVRPAVAVVEVMPPFFVRENAKLVTGLLTARDLAVVRGYAKWPGHFDAHYLRHRIGRLPDLARVLDPFAGFADPLPRGGHSAIESDVTPAERARRTAYARGVNADYLSRLTVSPGADRAFRDTLAEARDRGVRVVLLRMPEGPTFRGWYDPAALARFDAYLNDVAAAFAVPVLDARGWLAEPDFYDSHHVLRRGAETFTRRFAREAAVVLVR